MHFPPQKAQGELGGHPPSTVGPSSAWDLGAAAVFDSYQGLRDVSLQSSATPRAGATRIPAQGAFLCTQHPVAPGVPAVRRALVASTEALSANPEVVSAWSANSLL